MGSEMCIRDRASPLLTVYGYNAGSNWWGHCNGWAATCSSDISGSMGWPPGAWVSTDMALDAFAPPSSTLNPSLLDGGVQIEELMTSIGNNLQSDLNALNSDAGVCLADTVELDDMYVASALNSPQVVTYDLATSSLSNSNLNLDALEGGGVSIPISYEEGDCPAGGGYTGFLPLTLLMPSSNTDLNSNSLSVADFGGVFSTSFATVIPLDECPGAEQVTLTVVTDNYPTETTWSIYDEGFNAVASGGPYNEPNTSFSETFCLQDGCYTMYFQDSYGDGMCCQFGDGSYLLSTENLILAQGGTFASVDTSEFCIELDVNSTAPVDTTCDAVFTHDALSTGAVPYSPPSTYVFSENGIDLGFNEFFTGTGMMYGSAAISNAIPEVGDGLVLTLSNICLLYTSPSPRDATLSRMPSSA